jgi:multicomponent Na+:H+ antiporter subunit A
VLAHEQTSDTTRHDDGEAPAKGGRPSRAGVLATAFAVAAAAALLAGWLAGGGRLDLPWAPAWNLRLTFALDGLGALYGLLAAGIGAVVFLYATAYLPRHLAHERRSRREEARFFGLMALFLVAMVGLATAQDLILLFVFWDLTAIASYGLIGYDRERAEARRSALMALLVTGISAVLLLVGLLLLRAAYGTSALPVLFERAEEGGTTVAVAGALIAAGALAKSAQVPLHFWLPRAMAAPTPVSAYLHSAAMVAAGVFLLSRLHPLLAATPRLLDVLLVVGFASMAVGGLLALAGDELKQVLAHSTISQYGYVTVLLGLGGAKGLGGAAFYVLAHALAKSALFLTAGAVTEATGARALSALGGLARTMPALAAGAGVAAATLAALPLTIGFFKDELFFAAAAQRGPVVAALAVAGAALTFAYVWRFWAGVFLGRARAARPLPRRLTLPVAGLSALALLGGVVVAPFTALAEDAGTATAAAPVALSVAYHLDARAENLMALAAYALGGALLLGRARADALLQAFAAAGRRAGPERLYVVGLAGLNALSDRLHAVEVRDLRARVAAVLVPAGVLVGAGLWATPTGGLYRAGPVGADDIPLAVALVACGVAALAATIPRRHVALALALSAVGFCLAVAYALVGAPDVALVAVLIETIFALLFVGVFALLPRRVLRREAALREKGRRRLRDPLVGLIAAGLAFVVVWGALSRPAPEAGMAARQVELVEEAHGKDVVTVILADFRGLDTLVEITVVAVAVIAVVAVLQRTRQ